MLRNDAYWFSCLGLQLERADNTARLLQVRLSDAAYSTHESGLLDYYQLTAILRSVSALTAYHRIYREALKPSLIAELLILNNSLPCSLANCYRNLVRNLDQIGIAYDRQGPAQRHSRGIRNRLEHGQMEDIMQHGIAEFVQEFIAENATLGEIIARQYMICVERFRSPSLSIRYVYAPANCSFHDLSLQSASQLDRPDPQADARQPWRAICRRMEDQRLRPLLARSASGCLWQFTHLLIRGPIADLTISAEGLLETHDTGGVLSGTEERFPPSLFLRSTPLTEVNPAMAAFVRELRPDGKRRSSLP